MSDESYSYLLKNRTRRKIGYRAVINSIKFVTSCSLNLRCNGIHNIPEEPVIFVPYHSTGVDGQVISSVLRDRKIHFWVVKKAYYNRALGLARFLEEIPVEVDGISRHDYRRTMDMSRIWLEQGEDVGIFSDGVAEELIKEGGVEDLEERRTYSGFERLAKKNRKKSCSSWNLA